MSSDARAILPAVLFLVAAGGILEAQQSSAVLLSRLGRELLCATASRADVPAAPIKVLAGREAKRSLFATGDAIIVSGGTAQSVRTGDEYVVRRVVNDRFTEPLPGVFPISIHTVATAQIVDAHTDVSIAVVTFTCDAILEGDYLERFEPLSLPSDERGAAPDFARPGHFILAAERRQTASPGDFMVMDRGTDHGLRPGQLLTIFRRTIGRDGPVATIGSAKVYVVRPDSSVVRIETSIEAVYVGDLVAIHR